MNRDRHSRLGPVQAMLGHSPTLELVRTLLRRYAECDAPVLVEGETGTGKELAAREIHYGSSRREQPFVPVNCGAIPDTLIETELFGHCRGAFTDARTSQPGLVGRARGGTLFLDEVDALSPKGQVALLRFLQDDHYRPVGGGPIRFADVRVIAASNAILERLVGAGAFRRDLLYRLNALHVRLPALHERAEDIPLLAAFFVADAARRFRSPPKQWSEEALRVLGAHSWPGNVRELENVVLRAYLRTDGPCIRLPELVAAEPSLVGHRGATSVARGAERPPFVPDDETARRPVEPGPQGDHLRFSVAKHRAISAFERDYLTRLMQRACGNITTASRMSGTERRQLSKLLKKHGIDKNTFVTP